MFCNTDLIICLWLVPVVSFLFLPLALTAVGFPLMLARRSFLAARAAEKEKRKHQRFASSEETIAKVTMGDTTCTALVSNMSQTGICLKHLPEIFSYKVNEMSVVVKQYGIDCNLLVKAKWTDLTESGKKIGAEIETASPGWRQVVLLTATS
jgi:hypothetical protein